MNKFLEFFKKNFIFIAILIIAIVSITLNDKGTNQGTNFISANELTTFNNNNKPIINSSFDNTFYLTSLLETKLIDYQGKEKWTYSTIYTNPKTAFNNGYLAVWSDKSVSNIDVFNKKGSLYQINNSSKILDVYINKNGYVAILVQDNNDSGFIIKIYNNSGENIADRIWDSETNYPISISLSDDNRILALSEIDTNSLTASSYITFSHVKAEDNKNVDDIFSGLTYKDTIIANIEFSKNYLVAYSADKIFIILIANNVAKEVGVINVDNEIKFANIINDKYIVLALGNPINYTTSEANLLKIYDFNATEKESLELETVVTGMTPAEKSVIIVSERKIIKVNDNGKIEFTYLHNKDFSNGYYIGKKVPAIVAESDKVISITKKNN